MAPFPLILIVGVVGLLAAIVGGGRSSTSGGGASGGASSGGGNFGKPQASGIQQAKGAKKVASMLKAAGVPDSWIRPLLAISLREAGWNNYAANRSAGEKKAAVRGFDRNPERYACSGLPRAAYGWGGGGWFGFLPTTAVASANRVCMDPTVVVFSAKYSVAAAIGYARYIAKQSSGTMTPHVLIASWGLPSRAGKPEELDKRINKSVKWAKKALGTSSWLTEKLERSDLPTANEALKKLGVA